MKKRLDRLNRALRTAVAEHPAEALLFSGGLDSSLLAAIDPSMTAIFVTLGDAAPDLEYATALVNHAGIRLLHCRVTVEEAVAAIPKVIGVLKSFDPAIPNDLATWFGLKKAQAMGFEAVMTGDGADERFAGYDFMRDIKDLDGYLKAMARHMSFSSNRLGAALGLKIIQPFLTETVGRAAAAFSASEMIGREDDAVHGKWPLRKAFEGVLPAALLWQGKRPLEVGSGMTRLRQILTDRIDPGEMAREGDGITFYSPEHFYYYRLYKAQFGPVAQAGAGTRGCPGCGRAIDQHARHCRLCGWAGAVHG